MKYQHPSLVDPNSMIRLLDLLPGERDDSLRCEIRVSGLSEMPEYEALSYTWESHRTDYDIAPDHINVGESHIQIHVNLALALLHLRQPDRQRTLWIDALCIDQENSREKSAQVPLMKQIYTNCAQGLIWLGCSSDRPDFTLAGVGAAFDLFRALAIYGERCHEPAAFWRPSTLNTASQRQDARKAIKAILPGGHDYWYRIWTMQEAILPDHKLLVWESLTIPWSVCLDAAGSLFELTSISECDALMPEIDGGLMIRAFSYMNAMQNTRDDAIEEPWCLFQHSRDRLASDVVDNVFGLMGLLPPHDFPRIACDYSLHYTEVFARASLDIFTRQNNFNVLLGKREERNITPGLPSWSLDLVRPKVEDRINKGNKHWEHRNRAKQFNADARTGRKDQFFDCLHGYSTLSLKGICIDKLALVDVGIAADEDDFLPRDAFVSVITRRRRMWSDYVQEKHIKEYQISGCSIEEAFLQTTLGGLIMQGEEPVRLVQMTDFELYHEYETDSSTDNEAVECLESMIRNQAFFITNRGCIGHGPPHIKSGDTAWVVYGSSVPLFMRRSENTLTHELLGDGYVHGAMFGKVVDAVDSKWSELLVV